MAVHPKQGPGYRDLRSPDPRVYVEHHMRVEPFQPPAMVHPATRVVVGTTRLEQTGDTEHPQITLYALCAPFGLTFLPNADELEAIGEMLLTMAERMRGAADAQAAEAIAKAGGKL